MCKSATPPSLTFRHSLVTQITSHLTHSASREFAVKVREYPAEEVGRCLAAKRGTSGTNTWIAFFGDSNMRQKMEALTEWFLPPGLTYTYYLNDTQVTRDAFMTLFLNPSQLRPDSFDILGCRSSNEGNLNNSGGAYRRNTLVSSGNSQGGVTSKETQAERSESSQIASKDSVLKPTKDYEIRVTLLWVGEKINDQDKVPAVTRLEEWAEAKMVPDVLVIGIGKWLMNNFEQELSPYTYLATFVHYLSPPLLRLARRTRILHWAQSRLRHYNFDFSVPEAKVTKTNWRIILLNAPYTYSLPLMDGCLKHILRPTGVWYWDSTLPFNLANLKECETLMKANFSHTRLYTDHWWRCSDPHHASYETNVNEMTMLWNLLCNSYMGESPIYCCAREEVSRP
ncbi:hypothetical protein O3P69_001283 [Scylla paramamosain]|uniref:Uncharacterized protein n=2 Tax=Scylla paramamosain TaxID=85552 RepID=A0AAW0US78_SCYPA